MAHGSDAATGDPAAFRAGSWRGAPGFFRVAQQLAGPWSLLAPDGQPFFARGVHDVRGEPSSTDAVDPGDPAARLRRWNFNAVGTGGDGAGRDDGLAFWATVDFCAAANLIVAARIRLPDVFDSDWPQRAAMRAALVCAPRASTPELIGWVSDDTIAWGGERSEGRPGLLQVCLSLEPTFAAYHAAWEFALALHGGRLELLARGWGVPLANKEVVREMTRTETGIFTRGYLRDEARWAAEFARRYFGGAAAAVRAADPNHLFCGCRFRAPVGAAVIEAAKYPAVDVLMPHWTELPPADGKAGPVIAGDLSWEDPQPVPDSTDVMRRRPAARLTSIERMIRRGRTALKRLARHPAVVGYVWAQWRDEPGEQPPFARGLVHINGIEAREHTELLTDFNARADTLRRSASKRLFP
jgi:hypothetical protein